MESFDPITDESVDVSISSELSYLDIWSDIVFERARFPPKDYEDDARIVAVQRDDVKSLIKLADASGWFKFKESKTGNTLLHFAIMKKSKNVCDYLLSIPDFPLDEKNNENLTALDLCMELSHDFFDGLASDLVEKGASTDSVLLKGGDTFLHYAIECKKVGLSKMLMEKGHDVNAMNHKGETPLWKCLRDGTLVMYFMEESLLRYGVDTTLDANWLADLIFSTDYFYSSIVAVITVWRNLRASDYAPREEIIPALLLYGADPLLGRIRGYNTLEYAVMKFPLTFPAIQTLFFYTLDEYTRMDIHMEVLLVLAYRWPSFFHAVLDHTENVILNDETCVCHKLLFLIDVEYLRILVDRFPEIIRQMIGDVAECGHTKLGDALSGDPNMRHKSMSKANLTFLLQSDLRDDVINLLANLNNDKYNREVATYFNKYTRCSFDGTEMVTPLDESTVIENVLFLTSYGFILTDEHIEQLHEAYGFGELLKTLLHMDVHMKRTSPFSSCVFLRFLWDINFDLNSLLESNDYTDSDNIKTLLPYFGHYKLRELAYPTRLEQYNVSHLTELARNSFRSYLVRILKITTCSRFYSLIKRLPVPLEHQQIVALMRELYAA